MYCIFIIIILLCESNWTFTSSFSFFLTDLVLWR